MYFMARVVLCWSGKSPHRTVSWSPLAPGGRRRPGGGRWSGEGGAARRPPGCGAALMGPIPVPREHGMEMETCSLS